MSIAKKLERLLQTKNEIKAAIESKGVIVAQNEPFSAYPAKIAAITGGGAIPLAEYDMSVAQDNSITAYVEAVPEGYVQVRIEGTGAMRDYVRGPSPLTLIGVLIKEVIIAEGVTTIGDYAFGDCISLTSVVIPNSITTIGDYAFQSCTSLTEIIIPDSVTEIGESAFANCESLTEIIIPNSVTTIGYGAFSYCTSLTSVIIPNSVTTIGNSAFANCTSLTSVIIPNSVTKIGDYAFQFCTSLTEIIIPDSVTTIGEYAFTDCNPDLILKPEALEKPEGWSELWNAYDWGSSFYTVWWGGIPPQQ